MRKLQNKITGFSLVELVMALLLGALLLAWGVPSYRDFKVRTEVSEAANEIVYSLNLARAEAIRYGQIVRVLRVGSDWNDGWEIHTLDNNGNLDEMVYVQPPLADSLVVTQSGPLVGDFDFNRLGALVGGQVTQLQVSDDYTANGTEQVIGSVRDIVVSPSGTVKVVKP